MKTAATIRPPSQTPRNGQRQNVVNVSFYYFNATFVSAKSFCNCFATEETQLDAN